MRNISPEESGTWATLVKAARRQAGLSQDRLAKGFGGDRSTVWRWENSDQKPDSVAIAVRVADVLEIDRNVALRAAGFAVEEIPEVPESEDDKLVRSFGLDPNSRIVQRIMTGPWDTGMKKLMLKREREWVDRAEAERLGQLDLAEQLARRTGEDDGGVHQAA